jgi:hypothetical protein
MASYQITTTLLGIGVSLAIIILLRRDHLHPVYGAFWLLVAALAALFGLWPGVLDHLATFAGIAYAPTLLLLVAIIVLFIKSLHADMVNTRLERQVRRLNQRLAIAEVEGMVAAEAEGFSAAPPPAVPARPSGTGTAGS